MSTQTNQNPNSDQFEVKMYNLGVAMKDFQNFYWTGILLFWLFVPLIILFVKYVKYLIALNEVKGTTPDQDFHKGFILLIVSILSSFIITSAIGDSRWSFSGIIGIVLTYLAYQSFQQWSARLSQQSQSPNHVQLREGFHDIQIANLFCIIFIGIFMIPGAFGKTADALLAEYSGVIQKNFYSNSKPLNQIYGHQEYVAPTSTDTTFTPSISQTKSIPISKEKFCPFCGNRQNSDVKFCASCGNQME
ncbi:hypothetical protein [Candidatus Lokiarchaeum ossiferum]